MQLRLERNTLHMYTAGTSMSEKERAIGGVGRGVSYMRHKTMSLTCNAETLLGRADTG